MYSRRFFYIENILQVQNSKLTSQYYDDAKIWNQKNAP